MKTVYLKDICNFEKGSTGLAKATPGQYPLVATGADRRSCDSFQFDVKAVCVPLVSSTGHGHASLKNVHYQKGKFALGSILVALTTKSEDVLDIQFLHLYLSQLKDKILVPLMSGAANVALSVTKIKNIEITLPTITRQHEIVVQFKCIVAEEKEIIAELIQQQTLLKKLRQQILQEAIEGKLTKDWRAENPDIEPASELLKRIQAEKEQLIKDKKIKKQKALPPIREEEKPFNLPEGWVWCRLGGVANLLNGYAFKSEWFVKAGVKLVRNANVSHGILNWNERVCISYEMSKQYKRFMLVAGDIVLSLDRPIISTGLKVARVGKNDLPCLLLQRVLLIKPLLVNDNYAFKWLLSELFLGSINPGRSMGVPHVSHNEVMSAPFPLPPLSEQKAIVTKVEKLLTTCDQLETQITSNQSHAEKLMQAVLKEAFSQDHKSDEETEKVAVHA